VAEGVEVRAPRGEADWAGYLSAIQRSFTGDPGAWRDWSETVRAHGVARVAVAGGRVLGGAAVLPAPQLFGGREVPGAQVAAVCSVPEARGRGVAGAVLRSLADEARAAGLAVSSLWASRTNVYRATGWEVAGRDASHDVHADALAGPPARGEAELDPGPEIEPFQRALAGAWNGALARPAWWWRFRWGREVPHPRERVAWREGGRLTGILSFERTPTVGFGYRIGVRELWAATPDALHGLLAHAASHRSITQEVRFLPGALAPDLPELLWLTRPGTVESSSVNPWLLRLLDVPAALRARGWAPAARARVEFEVADPWAGGPARLVLEIADGEAAVEPGGGGRVRLGVGALAAWYAGGLPATRAARMGLIEGDPADLAAMDPLPADRPVWLPDHF
jgi:predicted acetyltransferase